MITEQDRMEALRTKNALREKTLWENAALRLERHGKLAVLKANTVEWWLSVGQLSPQHAVEMGKALVAWGEEQK